MIIHGYGVHPKKLERVFKRFVGATEEEALEKRNLHNTVTMDF